MGQLVRHGVGRVEALRLLGSVSFGRIAFTERALPAIRPVNHLVDQGEVIIRTHGDTAVMSSVGQVVAYEADLITPADRLSWSVIVVGRCRLDADPAALARYPRLLEPRVTRPMEQVIRIVPEIVTGYVLRADECPRGPSTDDQAAEPVSPTSIA